MVDERRDDAEAGTRIVVPLDIIPRVDIARSRGAWTTRARARRCAYIVHATGARHRGRCARDGVCGSASASRLGVFVNVSEPSIVIFTVGVSVLGTILRLSILCMCLKRHTIGKTNAMRARPRANRSRRRRAVSRANRAHRAHRASPRVTASRARRRVASWTPEGATRSNAPNSPVSERARDATTRRARTRCHRRPRSGRRLHRVPVVAPRVRTPATRERRRRKRRRR